MRILLAVGESCRYVRTSIFVFLFRSPLVYKFRILHRPRSVLPPVLRAMRPRPLPYTLLGGNNNDVRVFSLSSGLLLGVLGILWGDRDKEDTVPPYIKRQLLKAQRALRDDNYPAASKAYHSALERLASSQFAESQVYIEARAVVLDKV